MLGFIGIFFHLSIFSDFNKDDEKCSCLCGMRLKNVSFLPLLRICCSCYYVTAGNFSKIFNNKKREKSLKSENLCLFLGDI